MSSDAERAVFSRPLKVDALRDGANGEIAATEAEMQDIARLLDLVALDGRLTAGITQTCVGTLDPLAATVDLPVELDFWPAKLLEALEQSAEETEALLDWPEPIVDGTIDPGPVVYQILATSLEPYPKREGASFEWSQQPSQAGEAEQSGPFAALAALKRR
jgi:uncharacterized metal-binding protein YceD (DUF177 family)